jgi:hypothetical protein
LSWSPTLFSGSGPIRLPPVLWIKKTIEWLPFFVQHGGHCCCRDVVGWTAFWILLSGLQKLEQQAKKCIELCGECIEWISSLVVVACFLPGWAKDYQHPLLLSCHLIVTSFAPGYKFQDNDQWRVHLIFTCWVGMWSTELINIQPTKIKVLNIKENCAQILYSIIHLMSYLHIKTINLKGRSIQLNRS